MGELLNVPIIATRHVKKNFKEIDEKIPQHSGRVIFDKSLFSMLEPPVLDHLKSLKRDQVVLYGIEAHVCMRQTCFDLLENDFGVHLVVDTCSSMNLHDRNVGIKSMENAGANLISFQTVLFELMRNFNHPQFKSLMPILKDVPPAGDNGKPEYLDLYDFGPKM